MRTQLKKALISLILMGLVTPAQFTYAEDTDIYAADTGAATNPNILVVIDNSANWEAANQHWPGGIKQGQSELTALRTVAGEVGDNINLGLMLFTPGSGSAIDGGYIRYHIRQMTTSNKSALQTLLGTSSCTSGTNTLNGTPNCIYNNFSSPSEKVGTAKTDYSAALFDVFKYFGGYTSPNHATDDVAGTPTDASHFGAFRYAGNPETNSDASAYNAVPPNSSGLSYYSSKPNYNSPLSSTNSCAKNYVIFIGNGYPVKDSASSLLSGVGGSTTQLAAPDFTTTTGNAQTLLGTGTYANQAACETAAATANGSSYDSYSCSVASTNTTATTLGTSTCGQYTSAAACQTAAASAFPGYSSYTCSNSGTSCGAISLGTSTCGQYTSAAACQTGSASIFTGYSSYACTSANPSCGASTVSFGTSTLGQYGSVSACQAALASAHPGYASYTCTQSASSSSSSLTSNSCYASAAACQSAVLTANPGYSSVSCTAGSATLCNGIATTCAASNAYNSTSSCNTGGSTLLPGYSSYSCSAVNSSSCSSGKKWTITGSNGTQKYSTITGTGYTYTMSAASSGGATFNIVGNGGSTFTIKGNSTTTTYNIYGNKTVTTSVPTGTFTGTVANNADEWARFLNQTDVSSAPGKQNIITYTIDVFKDNQDTDETKLLLSMARAGGGKYFTATDENSIIDALRRIFSEIQSVNSVFASSSLPVSVNTQGTYLNQVFTGMFRPDGGAKPRWAGNLKQYKLKFFDGTLRLSDKNGDQAVSSTTGFISPCSNSFWSTDTGTYWNFSGSNALGGCTASTDLSSYPVAGSPSSYSDSPDGDVVEKGGAAQRLRGVTLSGGVITTSTNYSGRNLKTCDGTSAASCTALTDFNTGNATITSTDLGVSSTSDRDNLINWMRGQDLDDENVNAILNEMRPSAHGGVIHSQPAVIDYGGTTGVVSFYGDDEGIFHAIDGGQTDSEGTELWGFIAPETYGLLFRQRDNGTTTALVNFPGVSSSVSTASKDYFFDGSIGVYQNSSTVWIYPSMRRGGRGIYAFDVSTPSTPTLKWRKGCFTNNTSDDSSCSTGWSAIGQTWSKPQITYLSGYVDSSNNPKPVLVFGGGYDKCDDYDSQAPCAATSPRKGANIWFVDAATGTIITTYSTNYSVPGDVFLVKDTNGYLKYAYAADTGGYVYRINAGTYDGATLTSWSSASQITIASLSQTNQARKFLLGPDVVPYIGYNAVMITSGDREHPLENNYACGSYSSTVGNFVTNQFYMLKDTLSSTPTVITASNLTDVTTNLTATEADIGSSGFRMSLLQCEQGVNKPLTIGGIVFFGTNAPKQVAVNSCVTNLGNARGYAIDFLTGNPVSVGASRYVDYIGGGLPPSPVAGVVDVDGEKVPFIIGGGKPDDGGNRSPLEGSKVDINPVGPRKRVYWYLDTDSP